MNEYDQVTARELIVIALFSYIAKFFLLRGGSFTQLKVSSQPVLLNTLFQKRFVPLMLTISILFKY